jgi:archaellum biogenesis ATPase FlaH
MVIMYRIRQSAVLSPKSVMVGYGEHSETERVLVNDDELTTRNWLKIQSSLYGDIENQLFDGDKQFILSPTGSV